MLGRPLVRRHCFLVVGRFAKADDGSGLKDLKSYKPQDWNELVVAAEGGAARETSNGELLEAALAVPGSGPIGLEGDVARWSTGAFASRSRPRSAMRGLPLALRQGCGYRSCRSERGDRMSLDRMELPQGTLDLLILKAVALEPQHGWAISERLRQISSATLQVRQGSLYPALHRLERRGWIRARWGASENNRRAKYYELTRQGRAQLEAQTTAWRKLVAAVGQVLETV